MGVARGSIILDFSFEGGLILQAIISRETAYQRMADPIVQNPADIFPCDARHCGELILGDFLLNDDASLANVTTKLFGKVQ